jgi:nitrogen fixation NifU-like protein
MSDIQSKIQEALKVRKNLGEMQDADAVGTAGSADCGDMLRMWLKFKEDDKGRRVIDRATFQSFGCETAIAVASVATELLAGRTPQEALEMSGEELAAPLGALPPMKIHCAQLVEGALRSALGAASSAGTAPAMPVGEPNATPTGVPNTTPTGVPNTAPAGVPSTPPPAGSTLLDSLREGVAAPAASKVRIVLKNPPPGSGSAGESQV